MTETSPAARTFPQWLAALIEAEPDDRRMLAIDGADLGLSHRRVWCQRHKVMLNWLSAFAHLDKTEASFRFQEGSDARLHQQGDLVAAFDERSVSRCGRCGGAVVWAATTTDGRLPVDAEPNPDGDLVLTEVPDSKSNRPLAMFLHTEAQRDSAPPGSVYTAHTRTCRPRRRPGSRSSS